MLLGNDSLHQKIDVNRLRLLVESAVEGLNVSPSGSFDNNGMLHIDTDKFRLAIEVTETWLGYEFILNDVDRKNIKLGFWADTDLYPLAGNGCEKITVEILNELINLIQCIKEKKVYYKVGRKAAQIAIYDYDKNLYWLKSYRKKLLGIMIQTRQVDGDCIKKSEFRHI